MMLHSNEGVEARSSKPTIQPDVLTYQAENSLTKEKALSTWLDRKPGWIEE